MKFKNLLIKKKDDSQTDSIENGLEADNAELSIPAGDE